MTRRASFAVLAATCGLWSAALVHAAGAGAQAPAPAVPKDFPDGPGRDVVVRLCRDCHAPTDITRRRESRARWSVIVDDMIGQGARISDADFAVAVSYLSAVLGRKIRINEATAAILAETFEFSDEVAAAIVAYRTEHGPFKDLASLARVPGVDPKRLEEQSANLDFGGTSVPR